MALDVNVLQRSNAVLERRLHLHGLSLGWDGRDVLCRGHWIKPEDLAAGVAKGCTAARQWLIGRLGGEGAIEEEILTWLSNRVCIVATYTLNGLHLQPLQRWSFLDG